MTRKTNGHAHLQNCFHSSGYFTHSSLRELMIAFSCGNVTIYRYLHHMKKNPKKTQQPRCKFSRCLTHKMNFLSVRLDSNRCRRAKFPPLTALSFMLWLLIEFVVLRWHLLSTGEAPVQSQMAFRGLTWEDKALSTCRLQGMWQQNKIIIIIKKKVWNHKV